MRLAKFRNFVISALLLASVARADGDLVATITGTSGAVATQVLKSGQGYELQCTVDTRWRTGTGSGTTVTTTGATKGRLVSAGTLLSLSTSGTQNYVAVIAADGTSTTVCDVFENPKQLQR